MSTYAFIELPAPLNEWCGQSDALFPVLSTRVAEIQAADPPEPERVLFELEAYLDEYPGKAARFAEAGGELAFRTAIEQFTNGLKEASLQFYELSLRLRPTHLLARINYAIALHALAYRDEALKAYEAAMTLTSPQENLRLWILAAQIHALRNDDQAVIALLEPLAGELFPDDPQFWELLGHAREHLGKPTSTQQSSPQPEQTPGNQQACPKCGLAIKADDRFCQHCGQSLSQPPAKFCPDCGAPRKPGAKFCGGCGKQV